MSAELTIPIPDKIRIEIVGGKIVLTTSDREQYEELKETLGNVVESMSNVLSNHW